ALWGLGHTNRAVYITCRHIKSRLQTLIEFVEHPVGLIARSGLAGDDELVATRAGQNTQTLFDTGKMLIMFTKEFAEQSVVVKSDNEIFVFTHNRRSATRCVDMV